MSVRVAVLAFPGSCDDRDALRAVELMGAEPVRVWHADSDIGGAAAVIVPGGFSYGDYLRPGALAALSPAMAAVREHAAAGGPVLGICNGFQVLTEAGLLPGALRPNAHLQFRFQDVGLRVQRESAWLPGMVAGDTLDIPVKHHDGCYVVTPDQLEALDAAGQVLLRYVRNPNGSVESIACVTNAAGNVAGLMPHPEHAVDPLLGSPDGCLILGSLVDAARDRLAAAA
ncbi:MAG TPA: phosphoribosylformylglycinamidine synthase subunit PurQ [Gaiellales bacterium]|nr:phosphoribosylformylglycinamidine synthase subunit PurQ [Gaiellales bacterium]